MMMNHEHLGYPNFRQTPYAFVVVFDDFDGAFICSFKLFELTAA